MDTGNPRWLPGGGWGQGRGVEGLGGAARQFHGEVSAAWGAVVTPAVPGGFQARRRGRFVNFAGVGPPCLPLKPNGGNRR